MPTSRSQSTLPSLRFRPSAWSVLVRSSVELTNTWFSQMMGVAAAAPGSGVDHLTFLVLENSAGRFFSVLEPLKCVPRHCGQFSARAAAPIQSTRPNALDKVLIKVRADF